MSDLLDPELLQIIDKFEGQALQGEVWRVTWANRDPIVGNAGGGRWSPRDSFEALYTSMGQDGALAEVYYHLSRAPVFSSSQTNLHRLKVTLKNILKLGVIELSHLGIEDPYTNRLEAKVSQAIGEGAYMMGFQGLVVPSARWDCENLVIYVDQIDLDQDIEILESRKINWPAWKESKSSK
ncbi:MAG: RES family NAD+ phosphorylase [Gammaproteobacteria bacterium]|nr:RES family NAD+ phosphorylase [Gammaproteobacteria bacterium]